MEEVGEVENNPVSKAIARYLGIDISAEGRMAKNRKGIAIIIHGTPLSGMHRPKELPLWEKFIVKFASAAFEAIKYSSV